MANDVTLPGTGQVIDTVEQTDGSHRQKVAIAGLGDNEQDVIGATDETAASSDTATSGLNGLLKRIAQRLTSLIALLPSALTGSGNLKAAIVESTATVSVQSNSANIATEATLGTTNTSLGATNESAAGSDTATSGLNGRLQRVAQRITSLIALFPSALTGSGNFKTAILEAIPAGTNNIGDVDVATIAAGETHLGEVGGKTTLIDGTFTLDTSAYASGDVLTDTLALSNAMRATDKPGVLHSIVLFDEDDQASVALDLYFLSANNSLGTKNSTPSISDANAREILGIVSIAASDWKDLGGVKVAHKSGLNMIVKPASGTATIYVSAVLTSGTPTFTSAGLKGRFGFLCD